MTTNEAEAKIKKVQAEITKVIDDNNLIGIVGIGIHTPFLVPDQNGDQIAFGQAASVLINADFSGFKDNKVTDLNQLSYTLHLLVNQFQMIEGKINHLNYIYNHELSRASEKTDTDSKLSGEN
jgi:hypothetical protein